MSWEKVKLGQIVKMVTGKTPPTNNLEYFEGEYLWVNPPDFKRKIISESKRTVSRKAIDEKKCTLLPIGTVLLSCIGDIGKIGIIKTIGTSNQQITGLIPNEKVYSDYLYYFLLHNKHKLESLANKAVVSILNNERLKELEVLLPPLETQKRIANILDAADALRKKDQELLKKYDELAQAIFIEMFGDPVKNEKGWDVLKFEKLGSLDRGISKHRPRNAPELLGGDYPLIQTGDVANSKGLITNFRSTYSELGLRQSKLWPKGTLCITIAANIAKTGILQIDACFPDSIVGFIPNPKLTNSIFIQFWIGFLQKILEDNAPECAQKNINLEILRGLDVICPPVELQNDFSERISQLISTKDVNPIIGSEKLFNSLIQKAFKGELI